MRYQGDEWDEQSDARLRQLTERGLAYKQVAEEMGRSYRSVKARAGRIGIKVRVNGIDVLDRFADLLAAGVDPRHAAVRMGYSSRYGNNLLMRIREKLGPQAR